MNLQGVNVYGALAIGAIFLTAFLWSRMAPARGRDARLTIIYFAGLFGALVGSHLAFLFAEGWLHWHDWRILLSGRSITGGLLGGYAAVELAKRLLRYPRTTGDYFAILIPLALAMGRIGCAVQGCCAGHACEVNWWTVIDSEGVARWPAQIVELAFNAVFLAWAVLAARMDWFTGNRFHIYLIAYGLFRFMHEFVRDTPEILAGVSGYQVIAIAMAGFGTARYIQRAAQMREVTAAAAAA